MMALVRSQVNVAVVQERTQTIDWQATARELDAKSPLEIMDHVRAYATCRRHDRPA